MSLFGRKSHIGIDLGCDQIKVASAIGSGRPVRTSEVTSNPGRINKDDTTQSAGLADKVKLALAPLSDEVERAEQEVAFAIQGRSLITGYLPLPKLDEREQQLAVRGTVAREVPFPAKLLDIVHIPVEPLGDEKAAVFYSTWKKSAGDQLWSLAKTCHLRISRIEACGVALTRGFFRNRAVDPNEFYALVDIGFSLTQIVLVKGGYPYFIRDVEIGGRDLTHSIQIGTQVSWEEAEDIKKNLPLFEIIHSVNPILMEFEYEISRSIEYCLNHLPCKSVTGIFLSGGTAQLADFPEWLEEELRIPVTLDEWDQVKVDHPEHSLRRVAVGLALG